MANDLNITLDLIAHAESHPTSIALIHGASTTSFQELNDKVWRVANLLHRSGVRAGDVVALYASSDSDILIMMLGAVRLGATVLSLPKSSTPTQIHHLLKTANVSKIIADGVLETAIAAPVINLNLSQLEDIQYNETILDLKPKNPWIIVSGSGTTGQPKLIPIGHRAQRARTEMSKEWLNIDRHDVVASMSHLDFHAPKNRFLEALWAGAAYYTELYKENNIFRLCNDRISILHATVFHMQILLAQYGNNHHRLLPNLKALTIGGSGVSYDLRQAIRNRLTDNLIVRYASNETGPISVIKAPDVFRRGSAVGKPLATVEVSILDPSHNKVPPNVPGVVAIKSPGNFSGYINQPNINRISFMEFGFLPGDLAKLDADGTITHMGRSDQMMIFNGINIFPAEIETVLSNHPSVRDAISFPISHPVHQDVPVAAISKNKNSPVVEQELLDYCSERLGPRSPRRIFIIDEIPRNERGKVIRSLLFDAIRSVSH